MQSSKLRLPDSARPVRADGFRQAARQLERADLYLAAVEAMELGAWEGRAELGRVRGEIRQLRRHLLRHVVL